MGKIIDWAMEALGLADNTEEMNEETTSEKEVSDTRKSRLSRVEKSELRETEKKGDGASSYSWSKPSYSSESKRSKVVSMGSAVSGLSALNMVIQQPTEYNNAKEIARYLKDRQPVVVNLEKLDKVTAQKVVDFLSGAVYALDGRIQKVSNGIIVAVPATMGITGYVSDEIPSSLFAEMEF